MAIDKRLQIYDEQGNLVDYDILASDVKFLPDGKDLPTKLAEMQDDIDAASSGGGTVTGVKIGSTTYEPTDGVVDLSSPMSNKVDKETGKGLSTNDYTTADKTKLGSLPANPVQTISVNGGTPATPVNGNVDISVEGTAGEDGITPHIGSNGHWWIGTTDTGINATGNDGQSITDADLVIGNALDGQGDVLGMSGAMRIKSNIDSLYTSLNRLYTKLANMAFWDSEDQEDAAPTPVDWSVPQITVTLDKTNLSANAMITDASDQEITGTSVSVDEGSGLTLKIKPRDGYAITGSPSATIGGVSQTLTESNGVYTLVLNSVTEAITIVISATAAGTETVTLVNADGYLELSPLAVVSGEDYSGTLAVNSSAPSGCELPSRISATIGGVAVDFTASGNSYDPSDGSITIANVTGALVITAVANVPLDFTLLLLYLTNYTGVISRPYNDKRATVLLEADKVANPSQWHATSDQTNAQLQTQYSLIPIPAGATSVQMTCNSGFQLVAYVYPDNLTGAVDPGWQGQSYTIDLTQYSSPAYIGVNFKKDPEANFTNETLADIGFTLEFS